MTPGDIAGRCPACNADLPPRARFCPACGVATGDGVAARGEGVAASAGTNDAGESPTRTIEILPERPSAETLELRAQAPVEFPPGIHASRRRTFGLEPVLILGAATAVTLVATIVLFAIGSWIAGIVLLGVTLAVATLFVSGVRRDPDATISRAAAKFADRAASWARFAAVALRAGLRAAGELSRIQRRRRGLRRRLQSRLGPLGEAVLHEQAQRVAELKLEAVATERALKEADREAAAAIAAARRRLRREHATVQPTQSFRALPDDGEPGSPRQA